MVFFIFIQILLDIMSTKNEDPDQTRHSAASDLGCIVCLCPIKRMLGLN